MFKKSPFPQLVLATRRRLPAIFRFDAKEVFIRQVPQTGDVILSRKPDTWDGFFAALDNGVAPVGFLGKKERTQGAKSRDPFKGWRE